MQNQSLLTMLRTRFPAAILEADEPHDELRLRLRREDLLAVAAYLRDDPQWRFNFLENLCGVDYFGRDPRFEVVVHLVSISRLQRICLCIDTPEHDPHVPSLTGLYPTANYQERETFDLLGIHFDGHPALTRILMPDDWIGHPQRKDHPLGDEEVAFSFNQEAIYARKPFAQQ